jgi:putative ABC transport system permease protein
MAWFRFLTSRFGRSRDQSAHHERDLEDEIAFHLAAETKLRVERGEPADEAHRSALRQFGNVPLVTEITRDVSGWTSRERLVNDFRFALRVLRRELSFSIVALLTLALGTGATIAVFAIVNSVLLRPLPFPDPDRLVMVWERTPNGDPKNVVSAPNFVDWRSRNQAFEHIGAVGWIPLNITGLGAAEQVDGLRVSAEFFQALAVRPVVGRVIRSGEDVAGGFKSAVLSYQFWQSRYGGSPDVLGRLLTINGDAHEIVGVMPASFYFPGVRAQLFIPMPLDLASLPRGRNLMTVARLKPGVSLHAAQNEMERVAAQIAAERPLLNAGYSASVIPLMEHAVDDARRILWVLLGSVASLLVLACANVANLLLMRATTRAPEMAVRQALGAGRWRLVHQLLVESLTLTVTAGAMGLLLAWWVVPLVPALFPPAFPVPRGNEISMDGAVVLFALFVSILVGIVFGIVPAMISSRTELADSIRSSGRAVAGSHARIRRGLVVVEVALALVLVLGAGLMSRSLVQLYRVDPGFDAEQVLSLRMLLLPTKYRQPERRVAFVRDVLARIRQTPGVVSASSVHFLPLGGLGSSTRYFRSDRPEPPRESIEGAGGNVSVITENYFQTMGIPLLQGRDFSATDRIDSPRVVIVNNALARQWFPEGSPIGRHLSVSWTTPKPILFEIIGVAGDVRTTSIDAPSRPGIYIAQTQEPSALAALVVRTTTAPTAVAPAIRAAIAQVDPDQGVSEVQSLDTVLEHTTARPKIQTLVLGSFGLLALVIASVGLYGVMAYAVEQRRREMGVRLALGAAPGALLRLVVGEGLVLAGIGTMVGAALALGASSSLSGLLYETRVTDLGVLAGVGASLFTVAMLASLVPARRATRVDPAVVLRDQ